MYNRVVRSEKTVAKQPNELFASVFAAEGASRNICFRSGKLEESDKFEVNIES